MSDRLWEDVWEWVNSKRESIIADLKDLVNIPSVARVPEDLKENKALPFGEGCREVLDCMLEKANKYGFYCENHEYYIGTATMSNSKIGKQIGLWAHLDVIPAGEGWDFPPFQMTQRDGYLIGRGVQDNKSAAVGLLYVLQALKELNLIQNHNYTAYFGCAEEIGMFDVKTVGNKEYFPQISIIADCGYPVCYGESGILTMELCSMKEVPPEILDFTCGSSENTVPDYASLTILNGSKRVEYKVRGKAVHVGVSRQGDNALYRLLNKVKQIPLIRVYKPFQFPQYLENLEKVNGSVTMAGIRDKKIWMKLDLRYPVLEEGHIANGKNLEKYLRKRAEESEMEVVRYNNQKPSYFNPKREEIKVLEKAFQKYSGRTEVNYCMSGGTYARVLENAFGFGMALPDKRLCPFVSCGGDYHQPNESLEIEGYLKSIVIMILCISEFDKKI